MNLPTMQLTNINGINLEISDRGSGDPVVFIHGASGDECFAVLEEPALADSYRLIHYHRRGWGQSECLEMPVSNELQSADCQALLRHLGIGRAHFVGQSGGGIVALQVALDAPEMVHSIALLEPALPSVLFNAAEFGAVAEKAVAAYESGNKADAIDTFGQEVAGVDYRKVFDRTLPPGNFERWVADADTLFQADFPAYPAWTFGGDEAARISQPTLNMMGANTNSYFREIYETVCSWVPHAENFVLPNATHAMLQTNPKAAAERLASFFSNNPLQEGMA